MLVIGREDPRQPDIRALVEELDAYFAALYPAESNHLLDIETLCLPPMRFFAARRSGEAVAIGGIWLHADYAEIKRVYVPERARGLGLGRAIMARLEAEALAEGRGILRLEAGIHQPEALGLYDALGYERRGPFGEYGPDPVSVFMEKHLAGFPPSRE
jgi:putative acetyltransferase